MNVKSQMSAGRRFRLFVNDTNISTFSSRLTQSHQCAIHLFMFSCNELVTQLGSPHYVAFCPGMETANLDAQKNQIDDD